MKEDIGYRLIQAACNEEDPSIENEVKSSIGNMRGRIEKGLTVVAGGGGMKCSYTVGSFVAMLEQDIVPERLIASSGATGSASYMLSEQFYSMVHIWAHRLSTKKFANLWNFSRLLRPDHFWHHVIRKKDDHYWSVVKALDIDYLIDVVFKQQDLLKAQAVINSPINYNIAATNCDTGEVEFFGRQTNYPFEEEKDVFEAMRASKALPIAYGRRVPIGGHKFCDTRNSSHTEMLIDKAVRDGAKKVLAFDLSDPSKETGGFFNLVYERWLRSQSAKFQEQFRATTEQRGKIRTTLHANQQVGSTPYNQSTFYQEVPVKVLNSPMHFVSKFGNDKKGLQANVRQGYLDTKRALKEDQP